MTIDNPAARLHAIIQKARKVPNGTSQEKAWRQILDVPEAGTLPLLAKLGKVVRLPSEIHRAVFELQPRKLDLFLRWVPEITNAFNHLAFALPIEHFKSQISDTAMLSLEHVADLLSEYVSEGTLSDEQLGGLAATVAALREEVATSSVPVELRDLLLKHLRAIAEAIEEYHLRGVEGIRATVERAVGVMVDPEVTTAESKWPILQKVKMFVVRLAAAVKFSADVVRISQGVDQLLLQGPAYVSEQPAPPDQGPTVDGEIIHEPAEEE